MDLLTRDIERLEHAQAIISSAAYPVLAILAVLVVATVVFKTKRGNRKWLGRPPTILLPAEPPPISRESISHRNQQHSWFRVTSRSSQAGARPRTNWNI
jgi:hypothetical protein